ncbi:MAG: S41 family peptidase [Bacteroidales bacterium]|jgi:carboxyl-terminal processing protease|nr:S41 family peptidase [Bacteroidales bacterium]
MNKKRPHIFLLALIFSLLLVPGRAQNDFEIVKNADIFISVLRELNAKYADEISPGTLTKTAIDAMLGSLDPYTIYYPESQLEDFKIMTTGQYGGVGAVIQSYGKDVVFAEIFEGSPAAEAGLWAGDKIVKINNQMVLDRLPDEVNTYLKGEPGTKLTIEVERPSTGKREVFKVTRSEIKFPNIPYSGMLDQNIGYIKLDQFIEKSGSEVKDAFIKMKGEGMKYLILDLRNNGGGLMNEAINIMNIFVDKNVTITQTKGKLKEQTMSFNTQNSVIDKNIPVVVLVNEMSASASEIVAGAFQDLDRGVIIGKKTFGKGLVQNILPLSYNSSLKITISKYYIPSGRCVQNIDYFSSDTNALRVHIPDSLAVGFKTKNGRTVYDKGGIEPDIIMSDSMVSPVLFSLVYHNLIFDFANKYHAEHPEITTADKFEVTDALYNEFIAFIKDKNYNYTTPSEMVLKDLKEVAQSEGHFKAIEKEITALENRLKSEKDQDIITFKKEIANYLAGEIVVRYYYQKGKIMNALSYDEDIMEAKKVLLNSSKYKSILSGKK